MFFNYRLLLMATVFYSLNALAFINPRKSVDTREVRSKVENLLKNKTTVSQAIADHLAIEHVIELQSLGTLFNIPLNEWKTMVRQLKWVISQDDLVTENSILKEDENSIIDKVYKILSSYAINPERVMVTVFDDPKFMANAIIGQGYDANGVIHQLEINKAQFNQKSTDDQEAILHFQVTQLLMYCTLERAFIESLWENHEISAEEYNQHPQYQQYNKNQILRADLFAASKSINLAQKFKQFFQNYMDFLEKNDLIDDSPSHPTDAQRCQAIINLLAYLECESELLQGN